MSLQTRFLTYNTAGIAPAVILVKVPDPPALFTDRTQSLLEIAFFGIFGLYTAKLLINFKLNHPGVHNMFVNIRPLCPTTPNLGTSRGDAGFILGGPIAREVLSLGTIIFAICGTVRGITFSLSLHPTASSGFGVTIWSTGIVGTVEQQSVRNIPVAHICSCYSTSCTAPHTGSPQLAGTVKRLCNWCRWHSSNDWCRFKSCLWS